MPHIEASPSAKKGLVADSCSFEQVTDSDMVLCRNTMPLVKLCMIYLRKGIKAYVMGTDISSGLISLIEAQKRKTEEFSCENIINRLYGEKDKIIRNLIKKEKITIQEAEEHPRVIAFTDKLQTIETIAQGVQEGEILIEKLKELFSENKEGICLSTVHKSKGLEADKVYIIHEELMPSKYAKKDWEKQQERNLMYVAYTRAKSLLGFITDFDAYADYNPKEYVEKEEKPTEHVGIVGEKSKLTLTLVELRDLNTSFGDTTLFKMIDEKGNLFEKMGTIPERFIISNHDKVVQGTIVQFSGTIKAHKEFNGQKINVISTLAKI
jgi:superfamily I DNA/RNA helicase